MIRIAKVTVVDEATVELVFDNGHSGLVDFHETARKANVFRLLADADYFKRVQVASDGRYIEWPDGPDFCADALYERLTTPQGSSKES